jgi:hypothetical protein
MPPPPGCSVRELLPLEDRSGDRVHAPDWEPPGLQEAPAYPCDGHRVARVLRTRVEAGELLALDARRSARKHGATRRGAAAWAGGRAGVENRQAGLAARQLGQGGDGAPNRAVEAPHAIVGGEAMQDRCAYQVDHGRVRLAWSGTEGAAAGLEEPAADPEGAR